MIFTYALVLVIFATDTAAIQVPMADRATCQAAASEAATVRDVRRAFCLRTAPEEVK